MKINVFWVPLRKAHAGREDKQMQKTLKNLMKNNKNYKKQTKT